MTARRLVSDLGGTNVRFALTDDAGMPGPATSFPLAQFGRFEDALAAYLAEIADTAIDSVAIGAAGPADQEVIRLTNASWTIERASIREALGIADVRLVNDLEAVARAIPALAGNDLAGIRGAALPAHRLRSVIAINVGTGFGAAGLLRHDTPESTTWLTRATEAGHMLAAPFDAGREAETIESRLSGDGVARAMDARSGSDPARPTGQAVFAAAARGDEQAIEVAADFGWRLGRATRDLVLAHSAWDGAYLVGSVVLGWHALGRPASFEAGFSTQGPMRQRLDEVPVQVIARTNPALIGLALIDI